jgi:MjaI restriction endonuclease
MEFTLAIDVNKFRSTNAAWNALMLNDPWSVGYVTTLIELRAFPYKEDWEDFYYDSGEEREIIVTKLDVATQKMVQDESLIRRSKSTVDALKYDLKNLNTQYGRTKERLYKKGEILFNSVKDNGTGITAEECFECVRFRVICETWNGVMVRERNTIETLRRNFPDYEFRKVNGVTDHKYAVDYEIYKNGKITLAIQIKPQSYTRQAPHIEKARQANRLKNQEYYIDFGVRVFDVIADAKGNILNREVLKNL